MSENTDDFTVGHDRDGLMLARLHSRKRVTLKTPAAVVIREQRESA